jgi:uncharacterized protein YdeI (YjbR/CyaY-like superfamily)
MSADELEGGTVHALPADFRQAIETDAAVRAVWPGLAPLARKEWICWVSSPKKAGTRRRRIDVGLDKLRSGMRRPFCWLGCRHR